MQVSIPDGYRRLPYKTIAGFIWSSGLQQKPRYLGNLDQYTLPPVLVLVLLCSLLSAYEVSCLYMFSVIYCLLTVFCSLLSNDCFLSSVFSFLLSVVCFLLSSLFTAFCCLFSIVVCLMSIVCCLFSVFYCLLSVFNCLLLISRLSFYV